MSVNETSSAAETAESPDLQELGDVLAAYSDPQKQAETIKKVRAWGLKKDDDQTVEENQASIAGMMALLSEFYPLVIEGATDFTIRTGKLTEMSKEELEGHFRAMRTIAALSTAPSSGVNLHTLYETDEGQRTMTVNFPRPQIL